MDASHSISDHGVSHDSHHGSSDACTHAVDHYNHAMHDLSTHTGHAVDSIFGHHNYHDYSPGQLVHDTMNVYGAHQEMNSACGPCGSE
jgi:hypothetical protein